MSVNDLFLDDEGVEGNRVKLAGHVDAEKIDYQPLNSFAPIKVPNYRQYPILVESKGIDAYVS